MDVRAGRESFAFMRMEQCDRLRKTEAGTSTAGGRRNGLHELYMSLPITQAFARLFWILQGCCGTAPSYIVTWQSSSTALRREWRGDMLYVVGGRKKRAHRIRVSPRNQEIGAWGSLKSIHSFYWLGGNSLPSELPKNSVRRVRCHGCVVCRVSDPSFWPASISHSI
jgi:hypothetical protein